MAGGRPTKYKPEYDEQAFKLCKKDGYTLEQLADFFDVNVDTIYEWKNVHESFSDAIKKGKDEHDSTLIEDSLLKRAMGFKREVEKPTKEGVVTVFEEVPPDTTALIFWLKNRQPKRWRDKQEHEHSGAVQFTPILEIAKDDPE